jgi:hypothetical protein
MRDHGDRCLLRAAASLLNTEAEKVCCMRSLDYGDKVGTLTRDKGPGRPLNIISAVTFNDRER